MPGRRTDPVFPGYRRRDAGPMKPRCGLMLRTVGASLGERESPLHLMRKPGPVPYGAGPGTSGAAPCGCFHGKPYAAGATITGICRVTGCSGSSSSSSP